MTTLAMIVGMMPLALGITEGAEFRKSMGTVIIGGLTSSLFLTLFLVPVVYVWIMSRVDRATNRRLKRRLRLEQEDREAPLDPEPLVHASQTSSSVIYRYPRQLGSAKGHNCDHTMMR
jgi:hypothetical protein